MDLTRDDDRSRAQSAAGGSVPQQRDQSADDEAEVRFRAYERYVSRGGAPGSDVDDWLAAEREVRELRDTRGTSQSRPADVRPDISAGVDERTTEPGSASVSGTSSAPGIAASAPQGEPAARPAAAPKKPRPRGKSR